MDFLTDIEIENEINEDITAKPTAYAGRKYPLESLLHREFEILLYFIFKKEIELGAHTGKYDTVRLMRGVGERGRDCILVHKGKNVGAIQCKRYGKALTRPDCAREIIKFLLHTLQDKELISDKTNFTYTLASLEGFNEKALTLLNNSKTALPADKDFKAWVTEVIHENETIKFKDFSEVQQDLTDLISSIDIKIMTGIDIDGKLKLNKSIVPIFFEIEKVASEAMLDEKFKQYLGFTTDEDLIEIRKKIGDLPEEKKMRFGLFNIYGYDKTFYQKLVRDKETVMSFAHLKTSIDQRFIQHLKETIDKLQLIFISGLPDISPFTKQAIFPYLFNKYAAKWKQQSLGTFFNSFIKEKSLVDQMQTIEQVKKHLLEIGENVLKNDYSSFVGNAELIQMKKKLSMQIHAGFNTVEEMSDRFDKDMETLKPIIEKMEESIQSIIPVNPTIIIQDSVLNNEEDFVKMLHSVKKYE